MREKKKRYKINGKIAQSTIKLCKFKKTFPKRLLNRGENQKSILKDRANMKYSPKTAKRSARGEKVEVGAKCRKIQSQVSK